MQAISSYSKKHAPEEGKSDPNLIQHLSEAKQAVWGLIRSNYHRIKDSEFKLDITSIAAELDYSRAAVTYAVKALTSGNILEKVREVTGRGNHSTFRLLWTFDPESVTPPRKRTFTTPPQEVLTKDSPGYRYYAMKFRKIVEGSEQLKTHETGVTGKLLQILRGKEREIWGSAKIFLQRKVNNGLDIAGFFVWLNEFLFPKIDEKETKKNAQAAVKAAKEKKKEQVENWDGDPPKLQDFESIGAYQKAYDKFMEAQSG